MTDTAPEIITRSFAAQPRVTSIPFVALFADDAVVIDKGKTWNGASGIRAWRDSAASVYEYTTDVLDLKPIGSNEFVARVHLEGNF